MAVHQVIDKLFLSDQETVETVGAVINVFCSKESQSIGTNEIGLVVSIGCRPTCSAALQHCQQLSFPQFTDEPTTCLLSLWRCICPVIDHFRTVAGTGVIVHCVYGQSRSVSTLIAYLCTTIQCTERLSLQDSVNFLKKVKPSISINPGFLSQLFFYHMHWRCCRNPSECIAKEDDNSPVDDSSYLDNIFGCFDEHFKDFDAEKSSVLRRLLDEVVPAQTALSVGNDDTNSNIKRRRLINDCDRSLYVRQYICKKCKCDLCPSDKVVFSSLDTDSFVSTNSDDFWKSFGVSKKIMQNKLPIDGFLAVVPQPWMNSPEIKQCTKGEMPLICPQCQQVIGSRRKCGNYFGAFTVADVFLLSRGHIMLGRRKT